MRLDGTRSLSRVGDAADRGMKDALSSSWLWKGPPAERAPGKSQLESPDGTFIHRGLLTVEMVGPGRGRRTRKCRGCQLRITFSGCEASFHNSAACKVQSQILSRVISTVAHYNRVVIVNYVAVRSFGTSESPLCARRYARGLRRHARRDYVHSWKVMTGKRDRLRSGDISASRKM